MRFQIGERVQLVVHNLTIVRVDTREGLTVVTIRHEEEGRVYLHELAATAEVEFVRVAPADGEPRPGEMWADQDGCLYFACLDRTAWVSDRGRVVLVAEQSDRDPTRTVRDWLNVHCGSAGPIYRLQARPELPAQSVSIDVVGEPA